MAVETGLDLPLTEFPCSRPWPEQGDGHLPAYFPLRPVESRDELYSAGGRPCLLFHCGPNSKAPGVMGSWASCGCGLLPTYRWSVPEGAYCLASLFSLGNCFFLSPLLQFHVLVSWTSTCGPLDHTIHVLTPLLNRIQWPACLSLPARGPHGPRPEQNPWTAVWVAPFRMPCGHPLAPLSFWAR